MASALKRIFTTVILLTTCLAVNAQQKETVSAKVYFHRARYNIDFEYERNGYTLDRFMNEFYREYGGDTSELGYILIRTGCSPEGGIEYNRHLSYNRAMTIRDYLMDHLGLSANQIRIDPVGIDWSGLREEMAKQYFPGRWDMFALMDRYGVRSSYDRGDEASCQIEMIRDRGGQPWRWMSENIFPRLRAGQGEISTVSKADAEKECRPSQVCCSRKDTVVIIHRDTVYYMPQFCGIRNGGVQVAASVPAAAPFSHGADLGTEKRAQRDSLLKVPILAFRSNLLLPAMNIGIEVPLGNRWSVAADWYYPWAWRPWMNSIYPAQENCAQALAGYLEARYWFGGRHTPSAENRKYRLSGHSLALVGAAGYYDYGHNWHGRQGELMAFGLDYMYSLILGKGNVHMDFDIGLGYFQTQYRNYEVFEEAGKLYGDLQQFHFKSVVPVKAGVSVVVPIFSKDNVHSETQEQ